ncbi:hypothetical protein ZEAMMB73_Zm00001d025855 [Zea mays]|uniref:Uncharacterized protein n=1 Tax=Zea mays TaxID=4577 RepID=A0A1D6JAF8_MAIZE|nr:hypothetical protein ZEAMMB73_Zm00001d025855 [Zea mays]AQK44882.1 hypothetical protein ZEAMMB73_Zm00001d025855 [Zea mays]AQK44886.1 hypothetical protein ZEAMMB73_Zm00001d025855 [Zea mays]
MQLPVVPRGAKTPPPPPHAAPMSARPLWFTLTLPSSLLPRSRFQRLSKQIPHICILCLPRALRS